MPEVIIKYDQRRLRDRHAVLYWLRDNLPQLVAEHLGIKYHPEAALVPEDVELEVRDVGEFDRPGKYIVQVMVNANDYPERRGMARDGARKILAAIIEQFPSLSGQAFVWVRLGFGEFVDDADIGPIKWGEFVQLDIDLHGRAIFIGGGLGAYTARCTSVSADQSIRIFFREAMRETGQQLVPDPDFPSPIIMNYDLEIWVNAIGHVIFSQGGVHVTFFPVA